MVGKLLDDSRIHVVPSNPRRPQPECEMLRSRVQLPQRPSVVSKGRKMFGISAEMPVQIRDRLEKRVDRVFWRKV